MKDPLYAETPLDAIAIRLNRRPDMWRHDVEVRWTSHGWTCQILEDGGKRGAQDAASDRDDLLEV